MTCWLNWFHTATFKLQLGYNLIIPSGSFSLLNSFQTSLFHVQYISTFTIKVIPLQKDSVFIQFAV